MANRCYSSKLLIVVNFFLLAALARAQDAPSTRMLACETAAASGCALPNAHLDIVWTFNGTDGTATSPSNPAPSHLSIERFDSGSLVVRRTDSDGTNAGLTALYTGTVRGTQIHGTVQYAWPGHPGYPSTGVFSAVLQDTLAAQAVPPAPDGSAGILPPELLLCENNAGCNAAWMLNGSEGTAIWFTRNPSRAKLTVVSATSDRIVIRRADLNDGITATYAGSLRGDHFSGVIIWGGTDHPGDNSGTWTAAAPHTTCDPRANLLPAEAMATGQIALMFKRDDQALACYIVAAKAGDATAQTAVGLIYYQGKGTTAQDYGQAFFWLHKAADQNVYPAERTVAEMYTTGLGTRPNPAMAQVYTRRADEQKHDLERRQDLAERAADRRAQILSSFVLGASFGMFF